MTIKSWEDMKKTWMHITEWKKPIWKDYIPYDSNYMTFWKMYNYEHSKRISGCQGWIHVVQRIWGAQRIFKAVKLLCIKL